jgi:hypothetical protein
MVLGAASGGLHIYMIKVSTKDNVSEVKLG